MVTHRRFGKTVMAVNHVLRASLECTAPRPRHAYVAPTYQQAKKTAWDYLKLYTASIPGVEYNESELRADLPGDRRIMLLGAESYDSLRGIYLDGAVMDEYGYTPPEAFRRVIGPALSDRRGWALFLGTPNGRNHFAEVYETARLDPDSYAAIFRASETGILDEAELAIQRRQMSEEEYAQEFECSFDSAIRGAYYAKQLEAAKAGGRVRVVPWEPSVGVETAWDLGIDDATAIVCFQRIGREVHVIDYLEHTGEALPFYVKALQAKPYLWATDWLPHDAEVRELGSGKTRLEILRSLGRRDVRITPNVAIDDGIEAARLVLARTWFDETKAARLIDCLSAYRKDWDEKLQTFRSRPRHDWASHGADAFRYLAVVARDTSRDPAPGPTRYATTMGNAWQTGRPTAVAFAANGGRRW